MRTFSPPQGRHPGTRALPGQRWKSSWKYCCGQIWNWRSDQFQIVKPSPPTRLFGNRAYKEAFSIMWGHKGGPWSDRISVLKRRGIRAPSLSLPCKGTARGGRLQATSQEEGSHLKPHQLAPCSWTSRLYLELWEINFCCLSHPVCGLLWWQPE